VLLFQRGMGCDVRDERLDLVKGPTEQRKDLRLRMLNEACAATIRSAGESSWRRARPRPC
jgi:hypothetical protein